MDLAGKGMALLSARPTQPGLPHLEATLKRTGERRQALPRLSTQNSGARSALQTSGDDFLARDDRLEGTHLNGYFPVTDYRPQPTIPAFRSATHASEPPPIAL